MKHNLKEFFSLLVFAIIFWIIAFVVFLMFRYYGLGEEQGLVVNPDMQVPISQWLDLGILLGLIIGVFYAVIETFYEKFITVKLSLGVGIIFKTIIYLISLIVSLTFISILAEKRADIDLNNDLGWWRTDKTFWMIVLFFTIASLIFSFIKISNQKFGKGVFFNMLIGKYRKPREEKRIFMFLDLNASTTIAEKLGHYKYSQLIQDSFFDLNTIINKYEAEIYQYVGDEAVLSWKYNRGIKDEKCVKVYFDFIKKLNRRSNYYIEKYGLIPEFKAGLHGGKLIVAEVGSVKKELAYHGDVINTTARIQSECNTYNESLLISKELLDVLYLKSNYITSQIGSLLLKGKNEKVEILSINII